MAKQDSYSPAAGAYAQALLDLAIEANVAQQIGEDIAAIAEAVQADPMLGSFFVDPSITADDRWQVIGKVLAGRSSELLMNFLGVLNEKNRMGLLGEICTAYGKLLDERQNIARVQVTVAQQLSDSELAAVEQRISTALGKTAVVEQKIDEKIIGGIVLRMQDKIIDGSVKAQLQAMREQLLSARVNG